jgi:hypothetical protein
MTKTVLTKLWRNCGMEIFKEQQHEPTYTHEENWSIDMCIDLGRVQNRSVAMENSNWSF